MNLEIPKPNQIRSGTKSLRYLGPKICNFGIPYKIFRKSEQIGMDKFAHERYAKSGIMHFLRLFATLKLRTNHYFHNSLRSWLLTNVGYILHLSFVSSVLVLLMQKQSVCVPSRWFLHRLWGIEGVGLSGMFAQNWLINPNLLLTFILFGFYIICTIKD